MELNRITRTSVIVGLALLVSSCGDSGGDEPAAEVATSATASEVTTSATASEEGAVDTAAPSSGLAPGQGTVTVSEGTFAFDITSCFEAQAGVQYLIDGITAEGHTVGLATVGTLGTANFSMVDSAGNPIRSWGSQDAGAEIDGSLVTVSGDALVISADTDGSVPDEITVSVNFEDCE